MQANLDKFRSYEQQVLQLRDGTSLMSEPAVTVLGVPISYIFSQNISACCKKPAMQLNAIARILNINSHRVM